MLSENWITDIFYQVQYKSSIETRFYNQTVFLSPHEYA